MSERIKQIMEQHNCDFEEALEIMERENKVMRWFFNTFNPYGKVCH